MHVLAGMYYKNYQRTGEIKDLLDIKNIENARTYYILGKEYIDGKKIKKNRKKGMDYIKKAAQLGDTEAENYLTKKKR